MEKISSTRRNLFLASIILLFIAASVAQALCVKRSGYLLPPFFVLIAVGGAFSFILVCLAIFVHFTSGGFINSSWKLARHCIFIGFLNGLNGICVLFANPYVAGSVQALFAQANVVFTMALTWCILGHRFVKSQWYGATFILVGICIEFVPDLTTEARGLMLGWSLLFVTGQIPSAAQSVYQEAVFRNAPVNIVYMLAWSSIGQIALFCLLLPIDLLFATIIGSDQSLVGALGTGWKICMANSTAQYILTFYMVGMLLTMTAQTILVKYSSASLQSLILTLVTPCSSLAFSIPYLCPAPYTEPLKATTCFALVAVVCGVVMFRYGETAAKESDLEEMSPLLERVESKKNVDAIPRLMNSRSGLIASEYTADSSHSQEGDISILMECTHYSERRKSLRAV